MKTARIYLLFLLLYTIAQSKHVVNTAKYIFSPSQLNALYDLYSNTNGENWNWYKNTAAYGIPWNFSVPNPNPCLSKWQGITCNSATICSSLEPCTILQLILPTFNISGGIPESIGNLTDLEIINLSDNEISGSLPTSFGQMTALTEMTLNTNHLNGSIPSSFSQLSALTQLNLYENRLSSSIPAAVTELSALTTLDLHVNLLTGEIPSTIGALTNLLHLDLGNNLLVGSIPVSLSKCVKIQYLSLASNYINGTLDANNLPAAVQELDLTENRLHGPIPSNISALRRVTKMILSKNLLSSSLPDSLFNLTTLITLDLSHNQLDGTVFGKGLVQLQKLQILDFSYNNLSGTIPPEIGEMSSAITGITLSYNILTGTIPNTICQLNSLLTFDFNSNSLNGTLPNCFNAMKSLIKISLSINSFTGTIPSTIAEIRSLESLLLTHNQFTGSIPEYLGLNQSRISVIDVRDNYLNGSIPHYLGHAEYLEELSLAVNLFSGSIPSNLFDLEILLYLYLNNNRLTGSFPSGISPKSKFLILNLADNQLNGSLPSTIGRLGNILQFDISNNKFSQVIPSSFCSLNALPSLYLYENRFSGPIPSCLSNMTRLRRIFLNNNSFSGEIPLALTELKKLRYLVISDNLLNGTIPSEFNNVPDLVAFYADNNQLTGTIPESFTEILPLKFFQVSNNFLHGTIPFKINLIEQSQNYNNHSNVWKLLDFSLNSFVGSLPFESSSDSLSSSESANDYPLFEYYDDLIASNTSGIQNDTLLQSLFVAFNYLTNSIPQDIGVLFGVNTFYFSNNYLNGTIPASITNLTLLTNFSFSYNLISGPLPSNTGDLHLLLDFYGNDNLLTGTIPTSFTVLTELETLFLAGNQLSGHLPDFGSLRKLSSVNLSSNSLSGPVTNCFNKLPQIRTLILSNNQFTGKIDDSTFLNTSRQYFINTIDVSSNRISGRLPALLFNGTRKSLISFAAVENCFTGTISDVICSSTQLTTLALDGLHSSTACISRIFPQTTINSYVLPSSLQGSIPKCLFKLPYLQTLHLSGNGLTGSLPDDIGISQALIDLSLSHNTLVGTIPGNFQTKRWDNLDLSFNKITGVISNNITNFQYLLPGSSSAVKKPSLTLEINRLSGYIPSQLFNVSSINILKGNMFDCSNDIDPGNSLPSHDPDVDSYTCGSNPVNNSLYLWAAILFVSLILPGGIVLLALVVEKQRNNQQQKVQTSSMIQSILTVYYRIRSWWSVYANIHDGAFYSQPLFHVYDFGRVMKGVRVLCFQMTCFIFIIFLPIHITLGAFFHTYTYQYAWLFSIGYLGGITPAIVLLVVFEIFILYIVIQMKQSNYFFSKENNDQQTSSSVLLNWMKWGQDMTRLMNRQLVLEFVGLTVLNVSVVLIIQLGFVLAVTSSLSYSSITLLSLLLSGVLVFWNNAVVIGLFSKKIKKTQNDLLKEILERQFLPSKDGNEAKTSSALSIGEQAKDIENKDDPSVSDLPPPSPSLSIRSASMSDSRASSVYSISYSNKENTLFNEERRIFFLTHLLIFNNVIGPLFAALLISPNCFYYVVVTPPSVTTSYQTVQCDQEVGSYVIDGFCLDFVSVTHTLSYTPPFFYSYQCSSNLLPTFISFYIYRYFFAGVFLPLFRIAIKFLQEWMYYRWYINLDSIEVLKTKNVFLWLSLALISPLRILTPPSLPSEEAIPVPSKEKERTAVEPNGLELNDARSFSLSPKGSSQIGPAPGDSVVAPFWSESAPKMSELTVESIPSMSSFSLSMRPSKKVSFQVDDGVRLTSSKPVVAGIPTRISQPFMEEDPAVIHSNLKKQSVQDIDPAQEIVPSKDYQEILAINRKFFHKRQFINRDYIVLPIISEFTVFITFGAIFPPLALVVCYTIYMTTYFIQLIIGRIVIISRIQIELKQFIPKINEECRNFRRLFLQSIPSISILATFFWGFFLFDILGDEVGTKKAIWILFVIGCSPILIYVLEGLVEKYFPLSSSSSSSPSSSSMPVTMPVIGEGKTTRVDSD